MTGIEVPKLNNNDDEYVLVEWLVEDGGQVGADEPLVLIETSKTLEELPSPADGHLLVALEPGRHCAPGELIGRLFATADERAEHLARDEAAKTAAAVPSGAPAPTLTNSARAFAEEHGIPPERIGALGLAVVRRTDLERLRAEAPAADDSAAAVESAAADDGTLETLPRQQQAVAAAVTESLRTVPTASAYVKVDLEAAMAACTAYGEREETFFGVPELLVLAVARLRERHPMIFASALPGGRVRTAGAAHVGVTMDFGRGLFVPVVHDAQSRSAGEVGELLMQYRMQARRAAFREQEIQGANIVLALHNDGGVVFAVPIVFPGQTCAVSLGDVQTEPAVDARGRLVTRRVAYLGAAYDHRLVNGRGATAFLKELKALLESPEPLLSDKGWAR